MNSAQRCRYFKELWPAVCAARGWSTRDEGRRKQTTAECMAAVRGPDTDSTTALGDDEVTALFTYLLHLADPASLDKSARWVTCQEDYRTFNRARQADWHERAVYGNRPNRLDRQRFAGATSAAGGPLETLSADEVRKRHLTMATRHRQKRRQPRSAIAAAVPCVVPQMPDEPDF